MEYVALRKEVMDAGLLKRQYGYYAWKFASTSCLLAISIYILATVDNFALQLLNAPFLAFIFVQFGLIMHDAGHQEIFNSKSKNDFAAMIAGNLVTGLSSSSWGAGHNKHHSSPNHVEEDKDIQTPFLAFHEGDALKKKGVTRFITKYQAFFWFPLMTLAAFSVRFNHQMKTIRDFRNNLKTGSALYYTLEIISLMISNVAYFGILFYFLGLWKGFTFFVVHYVLTGLYMGTIFATNHKGMPLLYGKEKPDFISMQVLTTRNVKGSFLVDLWTGGLNYQIEHHLFPTMPRNNLSKAKKIVEPFCRKIGIEYYETGFFQSYKEILQNFHRVSAVLRKTKTVAQSVMARNPT